jgi:hypothetical protein
MALSSKATRDKANEGNQVGVIRVPKGVDLVRIDKAQTLKMVILPYVVPQGAHHPVARPGDMHYSRDYYVHRNFGASGKDFAICPKLTLGQRCPICEAIKTQLANGEIDKDTAKKLGGAPRTLYNVWLPETNKVILFDTSFHTFTRILNTTVAAKTAIPGREWIDYFADPAEGSVMYVTFIEKPLPSGKFYEAVSFEFDKHGGVPAEVLQQAMPLDSLLAVDSYDELSARFWDTDIPATPAVAEVAAAPSITLAEAPEAPEAPVVKTQDIPAPKQEQPATNDSALAWAAKGCTVFHKEMGQCTVYKNVDGVVTVMDSSDEPHKVKLGDLAAKPWPGKTNSDQASQVNVPAAVAASDASDDSWDSDWKD